MYVGIFGLVIFWLVIISKGPTCLEFAAHTSDNTFCTCEPSTSYMLMYISFTYIGFKCKDKFQRDVDTFAGHTHTTRTAEKYLSASPPSPQMTLWKAELANMFLNFISVL